MPSHDSRHLDALLPLLAILAVLDPAASQAVATAIGIVVALKQLH